MSTWRTTATEGILDWQSLSASGFSQQRERSGGGTTSPQKRLIISSCTSPR
ncbi:MAG: hypothetical protein KME23_18440 [Goleter apudmare HA4340-LM2]|nr:hypothetical protein [Goleter apudmare HA4340-LM2]